MYGYWTQDPWSGGKILKPEGWLPPRIHDELYRQGWMNGDLLHGR